MLNFNGEARDNLCNDASTSCYFVDIFGRCGTEDCALLRQSSCYSTEDYSCRQGHFLIPIYCWFFVVRVMSQPYSNSSDSRCHSGVCPAGSGACSIAHTSCTAAVADFAFLYCSDNYYLDISCRRSHAPCTYRTFCIDKIGPSCDTSLHHLDLFNFCFGQRLLTSSMSLWLKLHHYTDWCHESGSCPCGVASTRHWPSYQHHTCSHASYFALHFHIPTSTLVAKLIITADRAIRFYFSCRSPFLILSTLLLINWRRVWSCAQSTHSYAYTSYSSMNKCRLCPSCS